MGKENVTERLVNIFDEANYLFLQNEKSLILSGVSERSWYNRFAMYLESQFKKNNIHGYYVDTEYNRNNGKLKTIFDDQQLEVIPITCDIILHSRGNNVSMDNLICIEMKKSDRPKKEKMNDKKRIILLTRKLFDNIWSSDGYTFPEHVCGYKLGIYYEIDIKRQNVYIEYYEDGILFFKNNIKI